MALLKINLRKPNKILLIDFLRHLTINAVIQRGFVEVHALFRLVFGFLMNIKNKSFSNKKHQ